MQARCPHCGARNHADSRGRPCISCGRTIPDAGQTPADRSGFDELQKIRGLGDFGSLDSLDAVDFSAYGNDDLRPDTLEDSQGGGLGAMPTGDEAGALDLKRLLGQDDFDGGPFVGSSGSRPGSAPPGLIPSGNAGFRFGADPTYDPRGGNDGLGSLQGGFGGLDDDEDATRGNLMVEIPPEALRHATGLGPLEDEEESTRVVDERYVDAVLQSTPLELARPEPVGWRVRNERGVVYELMTVDAVIAWLEGKADISGVRIARGDGDFMEVEAFPELEARLGRRKPVEEMLSLDTARASERHGGDFTGRRDAITGAAGGRVTSGPRKGVENPLGFGVVLALLAGGLLVVGALVLIGVAADLTRLPPPITADEQVEPVPLSPKLAKAVEAFESGRLDAATNMLQRLSQEEDDPRIHRYLALALHQNSRDLEAQSALAEYRRRLRRTNGADGRQVREVRD